jgi:hypothetical protein
VVVVAAVGLATVGAVQAGRVLDPPPTTATDRRAAIVQPAPPVASHHPAGVTHQPPARVRTVTLVTDDVDPSAAFDRVYLFPGRGDGHVNRAQARVGAKPTIHARPGELLRVRLVNVDAVDHTWTFSGTRVNVTAFAHSTEVSRTFRVPDRYGSLFYFCAFRRPGMNGTLLVGPAGG